MPDPADLPDPALEARLARLAPGVDPEAATGAFTRHRVARARRRRTYVAGGIAAALLVVAGLAVAARPTDPDGGEQVLAGEPDATTTTTETGPPLPEGSRAVAVEDRGMVLRMVLPETATVGERLWVDVAFTNQRAAEVTIETAAPCAEPFLVAAGTIEAVNSVSAATPPVDLQPGGSDESAVPWDGEPVTLAPTVDGGMQPKVHVGRPEEMIGTREVACPDVLVAPEPIAPGASVTRRIAIDLRWVDGASVDGQSFDVLALTGALADAEGQPLDRLEVRHPVTLLDPVDRIPSRAAALEPGGMADAPTLPEWLEMTGDPETLNGATQTYEASLNWWDGAWETWITPGMGSGHQSDPLRIRFDPERMQVVDVRTVFWNLAPSDDPDAVPPADGEPVDEVRYPAG